MALLGLATVICDVIVLYMMTDRNVFRDHKYQLVQGSDAFDIRRDSVDSALPVNGLGGQGDGG